MPGKELLSTKNSLATIAVSDLSAAEEFYGETLGLTPTETNEPSVLSYKSGDSVVLVYESEHAGTNEATTATWIVDGDLEGIVRTLKARGVEFEHYDMPDTKLEGDVHVSKNMKAAWFKDPDGNILCLVNG